jgi:hypothetical protein
VRLFARQQVLFADLPIMKMHCWFPSRREQGFGAALIAMYALGNISDLSAVDALIHI